MNLPFDRAQFFDVMAAYNQAVWPAQVVLTFGALWVVWLLVRQTPAAGRWVSAVLAFLWAWTGVAYHWVFFTTINPAAWGFGALSIAGAIALAWFGTVRQRVQVDAVPGPRGYLGWLLIGFALLVYPLLGKLAGHDYPATPTFGLPCPTTLFTVGVLMLTTGTPRWVYVVPLAWSIVGSSAAFMLGVYQDLGLLVSAGAAAWALWRPSPASPVGRPSF